MKREDAYRWLTVYPRRTIRGTKWSGARVATVRFDEPLPADTVVVVEVARSMRDNHDVPIIAGRTFAFATGDSIYDGQLTGSLVLEDEPLGLGVVEIVAAGPDSVRLEQRTVLRRAVADSGGVWTMPWLPADGHRWLLRVYDDGNKDRRVGEREPQRVFDDTLRLTQDQTARDIGPRIIYRPDTPGQLEGALASRPDSTGPVLGFTLSIAEDDTGFVPGPQGPSFPRGQVVPDTTGFTLDEAGPGLVRAVFFVDMDADSMFSAYGDSADTLWSLEPWGLIDSVMVEPGLPTIVEHPVWIDTVTTWLVRIKSTVPDSLVKVPVDSLAAVPFDSVATSTEER